MKKTITNMGVAMLAFAPVLTLAQFGGINTFVGNISTFINNVLIPLIFGIALLVFIWGSFKFFILGGHDSEGQKQGKSLMMWAVVGFVMMVSIFGIVNLIAGGLGFSNQSIENIPNIPTSNN